MSVIGTIIDGSYRVERVLGEGGFGVVYECIEVGLKRPVALKMLSPGRIGARELERFMAEGQNLASLSHPSVVQIYRAGHHDGSPYLVMELVRGRTLAEMILGERLEIRRVLEIMRQVAAGLGAIHERGILHRDLSPKNIVVTENGTAKILDLGLSRIVDGMSSVDARGSVIGTLLYVSPEQFNGQPYGFHSEIFSFGVILYEVLTSVHPFRAEHDMSVIYNIAQRSPEPLSDHIPDCPPPLVTFVGQCLEKDPDRRPANMAEVESTLGRILALSDVGSETPRSALAARTPRPSSGNPYLNRVMIKHRDDFFGRTLELKRVYARLSATPPGSISIVGDRKIGKSSLLNYVYSRTNRQQHLEQPDKMVMVFLDLQQEKGMSRESFVRTLLGIANLELRGRLDVSDCAHSLDGIKDMVQRLDAAGFRIAILLDEFEAVTTNPNFSLEFFSFLRFLANHYNVAYITSSARDLQVLCHTKEISDSPFFNIFSTMRLSVFQQAEAEELIRAPSERVGKPLAAQMAPILEMSGLFPFFIQMACSHAIEYLDEHPEAREPDFSDVRRRFYEEAKLHYRYLWDGFDPHQKNTVLRVARGKSMPDALKHVLDELERRHYVEKDLPKPRLFSTTFDEFVRTEAEVGASGSLLERLFGKR